MWSYRKQSNERQNNVSHLYKTEHFVHEEMFGPFKFAFKGV